MSNHKNDITVFEHESIRFDKGEKRLAKEQLIALEKHFGKGVPYYSLCYNGIRFNEFVGIIQIGKTIIEVLPKADKINSNDHWRRTLIGMLQAVGRFDIKSTSNSKLKLKSNTILTLYFELFIAETEYLLHGGLVKQYRKKEGNVTALKGSLQFGKHIQQNLTHQEHFYVNHSTYDSTHLLHFILYKTIRLLKQINTNASLHSRIGSLLLHFPEMPDIKVTDATFEKIVFNRKNQSYKKAIEIARLLLLQYHPDVSRGRNHVLALMFDMNKLWEQFVYVSLHKQKDAATTITAQSSKFFWKPESGIRSAIRPDIVINKGEDNCVVLDTKWKNLSGYNPSPDDLKQLYVYHEYYNAKKVALVYPGEEKVPVKGKYLDPENGDVLLNKECSVISISVKSNIKEWQVDIGEIVKTWIG